MTDNAQPADEDPTIAEAESTRCPRCFAPYEAVRPGKLQPSCPCDYIERLRVESDELRARMQSEKERADGNEKERDQIRASVHWVELQRLKNRVDYLLPFCTRFFDVEDALRRLVEAKDEKDANGDTQKYRDLKGGAWEQAREALKPTPPGAVRREGPHPKDVRRVLRHRLQSEAYLCQDSHWPWGSWYEDRHGKHHAVEHAAAAATVVPERERRLREALDIALHWMRSFGSILSIGSALPKQDVERWRTYASKCVREIEESIAAAARSSAKTVL